MPLNRPVCVQILLSLWSLRLFPPHTLTSPQCSADIPATSFSRNDTPQIIKLIAVSLQQTSVHRLATFKCCQATGTKGKVKISPPPKAFFPPLIFRGGDCSRRKLWPCCIGFIRALQHSGALLGLPWQDRGPAVTTASLPPARAPLYFDPTLLPILLLLIFLNLRRIEKTTRMTKKKNQFTLPHTFSFSPASASGCRTTGNWENWRGRSDHLQYLSQLPRAEDAHCHALQSGERQSLSFLAGLEGWCRLN